jgi:hypothetical protein
LVILSNLAKIMGNVCDEAKHHTHVPTYEKKEPPTLTAISGFCLTSCFPYEEEFNIISLT